MKKLKLGSFSEMKYGRMPDKSKLNEHGIYPVLADTALSAIPTNAISINKNW